VSEHEVVVGGLLSTVELPSPFEPAMVVLNRGMRLNQARMDHEITLVPGQSFPNLLPYVDFRVYATELVDTTLVRVDHIWSGADQTPLATGITNISNTHYWNIDGLWPIGTMLRARVYYAGQDADEIDHDLVDGDEAGMVLLHRSTPNDEWGICPGQTLSAGGLTNGTGYITVENMPIGQFALGKGISFIGVSEQMDTPFTLDLMPIPASNELIVQGEFDGTGMFWWDVLGMDGRLVQRTSTSVGGAFRQVLDVSNLALGSYVLRVRDATGSVSLERRFEVAR